MFRAMFRAIFDNIKKNGGGILRRPLFNRLHPYIRLGRFDSPIGSWLLFWPCVWGLMLAAVGRESLPPIYLIGLFGLGAIIMRGAGCAYNDIIDRNLDGQVARTKTRPLPSGEISVWQAWGFILILCGFGFLILLQLDIAAIALGFMSVGLVALYPFMKRITWWPQLFLGLTFNWGALMGYAAFVGDVSPSAFALYAGGIFWTLGYDTIYAHQDKEDDALVGIKSSARRLGTATRPALALFYSLALIGFMLAGKLEGITLKDGGLYFWLALIAIMVHFIWQVKRFEIDNNELCLRLFKSNRELGLLVALAIGFGGL